MSDEMRCPVCGGWQIAHAQYEYLSGLQVLGVKCPCCRNYVVSGHFNVSASPSGPPDTTSACRQEIEEQLTGKRPWRGVVVPDSACPTCRRPY